MSQWFFSLLNSAKYRQVRSATSRRKRRSFFDNSKSWWGERLIQLEINFEKHQAARNGKA